MRIWNVGLAGNAFIRHFFILIKMERNRKNNAFMVD